MANLYTELPSKWWKWLAFPKFSCQEEAFMGCERHPVENQVRFLDGRVEAFTSLPHTRWERLTEPFGLGVAIFLAVVFAVIVGLVLKFALHL